MYLVMVGGVAAIDRVLGAGQGQSVLVGRGKIARTYHHVSPVAVAVADHVPVLVAGVHQCISFSQNLVCGEQSVLSGAGGMYS